MKKRRFLALMAAGVMSIGMLAGCGTGGTGSEGSAASTGGSGTDITLVMATRDQWLSTLESAATKVANENGYNLTTQDAQNDMNKEIQFVETARNAGQKACIVNLVDSDAASSIVDAAGDMNIVFVNRMPTDMSLLGDKVSCVTSDQYVSGYYQGEALAKYFKEKGKTEIKYVMLQGTLGMLQTTQRSQSVLDALEKNGIKATEATAPLMCEWDRAKTMDKFGPIVTSGLEFDCIFANNDEMALGAIETLENAGRNPADIPICGIDCTVDGGKAVEKGSMYMTVYQNPIGQGTAALQAAVNMINGDPLDQDTGYTVDDSGEDYSDHLILVPWEPVNADNVADYM